MAFVIEVGSGGVPVGVYPAEFVRAEHFQSETRTDLKPGVKLVWKILSGEHKDSEATRIVNPGAFGPKANMPKFLKMFAGREAEPGEKIDLEQFYGLRGSIVVEETENGSTRVQTFLRESAPAPDSSATEQSVHF